MAGNIDPPRVITDARSGSSVEMDSRVRRYAITMAFRTACFVGLFFVHGWLRWALFGAAVFLPYVAVLFANQANQKDLPRDAVTPGAPSTNTTVCAGRSFFPENSMIRCPAVIRSLGPSECGLVIRAPLTSVPFLLFRSRTVHSSPAFSMIKC